MPELHTARLVLRPLGPADLDAVHRYASDRALTRYMLFLPNETREETAAFLRDAAAQWEKEKPSAYEFGVLLGDELIFSYLVHVEKRDKKKFEPLIDEFEKFAENTPFLTLVKPFLHDNSVFLYDNPERLCSHYIDTWSDFSAPVTLSEEADFCKNFTNESLAACWRELTSSLRRVFLIGR